MQALTLSGGRLVWRTDWPEPVPAPNQALVDVTLAGICGTDLEMMAGYADFEGIPGHEFVGRVRAAAGRGGLEGRRVVADINVGCGRCPLCDGGQGRHCPDRKVVGIRDWPGCFASRVIVPVDNLIAVPDELDDEQAVFAEPLAAALQVVDLLDPGSGEVLVIGAGRLGQLIVRVLAAAGRDVTALCRHQTHRRRAREAGARVVAQADVDDDSFPAVVEAGGSPESLSAAVRAVAPGGRIIAKSTCIEAGSFPAARLVVKEATLIGSRCGSLPQALEAMKSGQVDPRPLIDGCWSLEQGRQAWRRASQPGALKVLLTPASQGGDAGGMRPG